MASKHNLSLIFTCLLLCILTISSCMADSQRSAVPRSVGTVTPLPQRLNFTLNSLDYFEINPANFTISVVTHTEIASCSMLERAANRYIKNNYLFDDLKLDENSNIRQLQQQFRPPRKLGSLTELVIFPQRKFSCENLPNEDMDEDYKLVIGFGSAIASPTAPPLTQATLSSNKSPMAVLTARTNWGILRGLETFAQLIYNIEAIPTTTTTTTFTTTSTNSQPLNAQQQRLQQQQQQKLFAIKLAHVEDSPRFKHRGFMLDTARHFIPVPLIKKHLDAMASVKFNVFHWHIVDDQSFPLKLSSFPVLAERGAFRQSLVYTKDDVQDIVRYAADRGIRVIPEFDTPGHSYALRFVPRVLTKCYNSTTGAQTNELGPVDPTSPVAHKLLGRIVAELRHLFPDKYLHVGGDEVDYTCWKSNPDIVRWMNQRNFSSNFDQLNSYFIQKMYDLLAENNKTMLVWEEAFDGWALPQALPRDAIVQVWRFVNLPAAYKARLDSIVNAGHRALLSACWYLNLIDYGKDWPRFYNCDPLDTPGRNPRKQELIIGGEACHWTEYSDETNFMSRVWPRAAAIAERLWSAEHVKSVQEFTPRLEQLRCRLRFRGIDAEPINGPGYC